MNLEQIKNQIQANAILGALLSDGSITVVYKQPTTDEALLFRTWEVEVLIVDDVYTDQVRRSLDSLGYQLVQLGSRIKASKDVAITTEERARIQAAEDAAKEAQQQAKAAAKEQATAGTLAELQAQINELQEDVDLMGLIRPASGSQGARGPQGVAGRDGRDLDATRVSLSDLADVTDQVPEQGQIIMWQEGTQQWELRYPPQSAQMIGGGGGGNSGGGDTGGGGAGMEHWHESESGDLIPNDHNQNLGTLEQPVGELYITGQTVYVDGIPLSLNANSRLQFDGNQLGYGDGEVEEAPLDGKYYVRYMGSWVESTSGGPADFDPNSTIDGGNLDDGTAQNGPDAFDGGDFETGISIGSGNSRVDGGDFTADPMVVMALQLEAKDAQIADLQQQMADVLARLTALESSDSSDGGSWDAGGF